MNLSELEKGQHVTFWHNREVYHGKIIQLFKANPEYSSVQVEVTKDGKDLKAGNFKNISPKNVVYIKSK